MSIDFNVKSLIVHILDNTIEMPVLSDKEQELEADIIEFIGKHIEKILRDSKLKNAEFVGEENPIKELCEEMSNNWDKFTSTTALIASRLFDIMKKHVNIPSADIVCLLFKLDNVLHLGILKFNYKHSYIHNIENSGDGRVNSIIKQKTTLPSESQRVEECAIINLEDFTLKLLEKKYEIDGEKMFYFSDLFLKCSTEVSSSEKVKLFTKATDKFTKKYFGEDYLKQGEIKKVVAQSIDEDSGINVEKIAHHVFEKNPELKTEYVEQVKKTGVSEEVIPVETEREEKKFRNQKIKTDTGIEINLPTEYYGDDDKVEFINNIDGTISILIKNVGKVINK
ncbi:nucleoid-associated protein [Clostridiisalibacter paucivorans]|uniref:nucleoid-associated protein n=1 Tax=Clostridiisalibacter paucivorans TaxID=408753 RepID=UPI00047A3A59|nr:nucleoid-associated protein [Clostridiisalibacter paucivorans]